MLKQHARAIAAGLRLFDLAMLAAGFFAAYFIRDSLLGARLTYLYDLLHYWPILPLSLLLWLGAAWFFQVYAAYRTLPFVTEVGRLARAMALVAVLMAATGWLTRHHDISRLLVALQYAIAFGLIVSARVGLRLVARAARRRGYNTRSFAVVGSGALAHAAVNSLLAHRHWGFTFAGYILDGRDPPKPSPPRAPVLGTLADLEAVLQNHIVDQVIFAVPRDQLEEIEHAVLLCEEQGVGVRVCLDLFPSRRIAKLAIEEVDGIPVVSFTSAPSDVLALSGKRIFDVAVSLLALVVLSPLYALVALAVKLDSPGPVFFRQRRIGENGREFTLYKFRSMYVGAESLLPRLREQNEMDGPVFKMARDPRVTRVGRLLRRTSIDELPQFWNVLRGEMSVVGPRPPLAHEVREYERWQRRRLSVRPGLTCTWQVSGRSEVDFDRWMELDLHYIDNWSLWHDMKIVLKTIPAVLLGRGAR